MATAQGAVTVSCGSVRRTTRRATVQWSRTGSGGEAGATTPLTFAFPAGTEGRAAHLHATGEGITCESLPAFRSTAPCAWRRCWVVWSRSAAGAGVCAAQHGSAGWPAKPTAATIVDADTIEVLDRPERVNLRAGTNSCRRRASDSQVTSGSRCNSGQPLSASGGRYIPWRASPRRPLRTGRRPASAARR